jgi:NADH dehydrogenase (ubiquinone) 1 beta subcomplex subunit 11
MSLITRLNRLTVLRNILASAQSPARCISTSPKKSDTATISQEKTETVSGTEQFAAKTKNWVYWGFDTKDQANDENTMKASFFFSVTLCLVWGSFVYFYQPDPLLRDWSQREAYLELRRREAAGLDPIDANYVDPASIELPSDEDLGNTEIII